MAEPFSLEPNYVDTVLPIAMRSDKENPES